MSSIPWRAVNVGERMRVEALAAPPLASTAVAAVALAEDRFRVLNPEAMLDLPRENAEELVRRSTRDVWEIGDIVVRAAAPRLVLDVVVYDLDVEPIVSADNVVLGLRALMNELSRRQLTMLAMEPLGMAHGGIAAVELAAALYEVGCNAPCGLNIQLCDPVVAVLDEVLDALAEQGGP